MKCAECGLPLMGETEIYIRFSWAVLIGKGTGVCSAPDGVDPARFWADAPIRLSKEIASGIVLGWSVQERRPIAPETPIRHYRWRTSPGGRGCAPVTGWMRTCLHNVAPCPHCGIVGDGHLYWCPVEVQAKMDLLRRLQQNNGE